MVGRALLIGSAALLAASCLAEAGFGQAAPAPAPAVAASPDTALPAGPDRELVLHVCSGCHSADIAARQRLDRKGWTDLVNTMAGNGATATDPEFARIIDYLAHAFPPDGSKDVKPG